MGTKCTHFQSAERVNIVLKYICRGWGFHKIVHYCLQYHQDWGVDEGAIRRYWNKANNLRVKNVTLNRDFHLNNSIARLTDIYEQYIEKDEMDKALEVESRLQDLLSLKEAYGHQFLNNQNTSIEGVFDFKFEEIDVDKAKGVNPPKEPQE